METLDKVIETVNSLYHHQTELESVFQSTEMGHIDDVMETMSFGFDLQMYMALMEEEHVNQYYFLELASKDCHMNCSLIHAYTLIINWQLTISPTIEI